MSKVIKHSKKKEKKQVLVVLSVVVAIILLLFGLNYILGKNNKGNIEVVESGIDLEKLKGNENATVRIIEYSDFQCTACSAFATVFTQVYDNITEKYGEEALSIAFKHFPLTSIHPNALLAGYSSEAAKLQGKFWEMHDILFANQTDWGNALDAKSKIEGYARELGLDMAEFIQDRDSTEVKKIVDNSLVEAKRLGLTHTPFVFMDGVEMENLRLDVNYIQNIIERRLIELGISPINQVAE